MPTLLLALFLLACAPLPAIAHPSLEHRIAKLTERIEADPTNQKLRISRGQAYSNEGMLDAALLDLRKAETLGEPVHVAFDLGVVHYQMGDLEAAKASFDRFLARFPNHPQTLQYRARVSRDAGDLGAAVADFKTYFRLQKSPNPGDYVSAASLIEQLEDGGIEAAIALLDEGIERLGVIPQLQRPAIALERKRANLGAAIARMETLEPMIGQGPDWKVDMGELLREAKRASEANAMFERAAKQLDQLRPTDARRALRTRLDSLRSAGAS